MKLLINLGLIISVFFQSLSAQILEESNLPILMVDTYGAGIESELKIEANLMIIDNGEGQTNAIDDELTAEYMVGIKFRGSSSQGFDKNSFSVETWDENGEDGEDIDVALLGLPEEEDWVFHGPFADKTLVRNALTMQLSQDMGNYASRYRFFEFVLNDDYKGVYLLMEKMKRDKNRIDIAAQNPDDSDNITGGYVLKIDWPDEGSWTTEFETVNGEGTFIEYVYPKFDEITEEQENYIQGYIYDFEEAVFADDFTNTKGQRYDELIDLNSFVDFMIINELSKNVDGYKLSSFLYKDKDGPLKAGPIWDFNIAWYNSDYCAGDDYQNWIFNEAECEDLELMPLWWERFWEDPIYKETLECRWTNLRANEFSNENIIALVDAYADLLADAQERNYERWDVLEEYTWGHPEVPGTYAGEIENLKTFIANRLGWMDEQLLNEACEMPVDTTDVMSLNELDLLDVSIGPNPSQGIVSIHHSEKVELIEVYDLNGSLLRQFAKEEIEERMDWGFLGTGTKLVKIVTKDGADVFNLVLVK